MATTTAASTTATTGRLARLKAGLTPQEWRRAGLLAAAVGGLHLLGWGVLLVAVVPQHYHLEKGLFGVGIGVTAYTLGMRHAFDADHIAAIDNTTRKFMQEGKRPLSVGFFFSLGHSSVVFLLTLLLALGLKIVGAVKDDASTLHKVTNLVGPAVSGTFLYVIAAVNFAILLGIVRVFREMRQGRFDEHQLEKHLAERGLMNRFLGGLNKRIREPWQMYPMGFLFGLGFDTATEVGLLVIAGGAIASGLPFYAFLTLPVLFAAGMSLFDTIDGSFMNFAYGWAFSNPVRKVFYNFTVTALSIAVAFLIGTVELLQILQDRANLGGAFWSWVKTLNLNTMGYAVVGLFVVTWAVAVAVYRAAGIEDRWTARLQPAGPSEQA